MRPGCSDTAASVVIESHFLLESLPEGPGSLAACVPLREAGLLASASSLSLSQRSPGPKGAGPSKSIVPAEKTQPSLLITQDSAWACLRIHLLNP